MTTKTKAVADEPLVKGPFRQMRRTGKEATPKKQYPTLSLVLSPEEANRWNQAFTHVQKTEPLITKSILTRELIGFVEPKYLTKKEIDWIRTGKNAPEWARPTDGK